MIRRTLTAGALTALATTAAIGAAAVAPGAASAAPPPAAQVQPFAGLTDGQMVTVNLSGFAANETLYVAQCTPAIASSQSPNDCDLNTVQTAQTGADGTATASLTVASTSYSDGNNGKCDQFDHCLVLVTNAAPPNTPTEVAAAPIYFGPTVLASQSTGLTNGQSINAGVYGFTQSATANGGSGKVYVGECDAAALNYVNNPSSALNYCDFGSLKQYPVDANGDASPQNPAYQILAGKSYSDNAGGKCDAKHSCLLVAATVNSQLQVQQFNYVPISFANSVVTTTATATSLKPSHKSGVKGHKVRVIARTKPTRGGEGAFGGRLVVTDNGKRVGSFREHANGVVRFTVKLAKGKNRITATYTGNRYFQRSSGHATVTGKVRHRH